MYPKPLELKNRSKTKTAPRELFDLTDEGEAKVQNLCEVVNLDDSDFNIDGSENPRRASETPDIVQRFTRRVFMFSKCLLCEQKIGAHQFQSHIDCCRGFQKKVVFSVTKSRK